MLPRECLQYSRMVSTAGRYVFNDSIVSEIAAEELFRREVPRSLPPRAVAAVRSAAPA